MRRTNRRARLRRAVLAALFAGELLLVAAPAGAAKASVSLSLDKHIVSLGERVSVTVTITIDGRDSYSQFVPPSMTGLRATGGAMTSQNIQVINWNIRRQETRRYSAVAVQAGQLTIGPAAVRYGGRLIKSNVVKLKVTRSGSTAPNANPQPGQPQPGQPQPGQPQPGQPQPGRPSTGWPSDHPLPGVFLGATAVPDEVYLGQQVIAEWRLYTQSDVLGFQTLKQPTTDSFWSEDLLSPRRLNFERMVIDNRVFHSAILQRKALFPQKTGRLVIGPLQARVRTLNLFSSSAPQSSSPSLSIEVKPLPERGKPKDFPEQNVGRFAISASVDRSRLGAGEATTLKLIVRGRGNLRQLQVPELPKVAGLKLYEPKQSHRFDSKQEVSGERIVERLVLATKPGKVTIPALTLHFFDPESKSYQRSSTEPLTLEVSRAAAGKPSTHPGAPAEKNVLGRDIRPPHAGGELEDRPASRVIGPLRLTLLGLPLVALLVVIGGGSLRMRLSRQTARSLGRQAARRVQRRLARAKQLAKHGEGIALFAELAGALREQLDHQMGVRIEGYTRDELRRAMDEADYPEQLVREVIEELDNCDFARFSRSASEPEQLRSALQRTTALIRALASQRVRRATNKPRGEQKRGRA